MFYSQFSEDKILSEIFRNKTHGICVEVGANNGVDDSTSFYFEKIGWKCILVEPNPFLCQGIRAVRNALLYEYAASNGSGLTTLYIAEGAARSDGLSTISINKEEHDRIKSFGFKSRPVRVQTMTLDNILIDAQIDGHIDFISIDVEGHEKEVLEGFSIIKWQPKILLVEDNSNFENNVISNYLKELRYVRFRRTGVNDWYAHRANKQLVNLRSVFCVMIIKLKVRLQSRFLLIPLVLRIKNFLKSKGV